MKRFTIGVLVVMIAGMALFAEGAQEERGLGREGEVSTLSGTLDLSGEFPVLTSGGEEYVVMVPRGYEQDLDIADGSVATITGYVHDSYGRYIDADATVISVTEAVVNGETLTFEALGRGYAANGTGMGNGGRRAWDSEDEDFGSARYARRR